MKRVFLLVIIVFIYFSANAISDDSLFIKSIESGRYNVEVFNLGKKLFERYMLSSPHKALEYAAICSQIADSIGDSLYIARAELMLGRSYLENKNYSMAAHTFFEAYSIFKKNKIQSDLAETLLLWASVYAEQNNFEVAEEKVRTAVKTYRALGDSAGVAHAFFVMGNVYADYESLKAKQCYEKALAIDYNDTVFVQKVRLKLAETYLQLGQNKLTISILDDLLPYFQQKNDSLLLAESYRLYGDLENEKKDYQKAVEVYSSALDIYKDLNISSQIARLKLRIAQSYFLAKQYSQSKLYLSDVIKYAKSYQKYDLLKDAYLLMKEIYVMQNDIQTAYDYSELYTQALIKFYEDKNLKNFSSFEMNIEMKVLDKDLELIKMRAEKEKLQLAQEQYKKNKIYVSLILITVFVLLIVLYLRFRERRRVNNELKNTNKRLKNEIEERRKAEKTAKSNEERYKLLFSQSPIGIVQFDENLTVTEVNERFAEIFNAKASDVKNKQLDRILDRKTVKKIADLFYNSQDNILMLESQIPVKNEVLYVAITVKKYAYFDKGEEIIGGIIIIEDLTEQKRKELLYKKNVFTKQKLFDNLPDDLILIDKNENVIESFFPSVPSKELMFSKLEDIFHENTLAIFRAHLNKVNGSGHYTQFFITDRQKNYLVRIFDKEQGFLIIISRYIGNLSSEGIMHQRIGDVKEGKDEYLKNIKEDINDLLLPMYQNIQRGLSFIMIKNFAERIIDIGKKHKNAKIQSYGEELLDYVTSFNVMKVNEQLEKFPSFIGQFLDLGFNI